MAPLTLVNPATTSALTPFCLHSLRSPPLQDLNVLLMNNREYAAEIAHGVSAKKRQQIVSRAAQLDVKVLNGKARIQSADK